MPRIETRVTSVQVVSGFAASLVIPNPPGWRSSVISSPRPPTPTGDADTAGNVDPSPVRRRYRSLLGSPKSEEETFIMLADDSILSEGTQSGSEPSNISTVNGSVGSNEHQGSFQSAKIHNEEVYVNYVVGNGDWLDEPPTTLDFTSCKKGPTIYVNDVTGKNVTQLWWWESDKWVSVKEGEVFLTERERTLELDKQRIPRLRAIRRRPRS